MGTIITARKVRLTEAVQINSEEEEKIVRQWIAESYGDEEAGKSADLEELKSKHFYFMRDKGSNILFLMHPADFLSDYEEVSEEELEAINDPFKF